MPDKTKSEYNEEEFESYIFLKAREIAQDAHCAVCDGSSGLCAAKIHKTTNRIKTLVSEAIYRHSNVENLPIIE